MNEEVRTELLRLEETETELGDRQRNFTEND